jgi:hypothetical protein
MTNGDAERWHFGDRWYATTLASWVRTRDGMGLELEDVGPAPGRGIVLEAFYDDTTGEMSFIAHVTESLPFELVGRFIVEARERLPPASG